MNPTTIIVIGLIIAGGVYGITKFLKSRKKKEDTEVKIKPGDSSRKPIKKALLVGINKYKPELNADLKGCVNDVENTHNVLVSKYGFDPENIRVVADDRATRAGILDRLRWLIDECIPGDELVFHYSGHGSQVRDRNGDELNDQLDEILCPHDLDWNNPLTDDVLAALFKQVPKGVHLTMICDSCHSGTMTKSTRLGNPHAELPRYIQPPFDIIARSKGRDLEIRKIGKKPKRKNQRGKKGKKDTGQNHVLISGCKDNQTSADAFIDNKYQGAFTWALTYAIEETPGLTFRSAHARAQKLLANRRYSQIPQLSGNDNLLDRPLFGGEVK